MSVPADHTPRAPVPPVRAGSPAGPAGGRGAPFPRRRPDPRPARLALAAGGIATISALLALIGGAAIPAASAAPAGAAGTGAGGASDLAPVRHVVRVVVLAPGEQPPTGASTTPGTLAVPVSPPQVTRQPTIRTSQSGRP